MEDEKVTEPAKKPNKTPNMRELESRMNAAQEANNERLDGLDEDVGEIKNQLSEVSAGQAEMMELLRGMSAQDRGGMVHPETHSEALETASPGVAEFADDGELQTIVTTDATLDDPIMQDKLNRLAFDKEIVEIHIAETNEEQADPRIEVGVNGQQFVMLRGNNYKVPRYVVEGLCRAKPFAYANQEYTTDEGVRKVRYRQSMGVRYPFSVINDPNPLGGPWLAKLLSERM